MSSISLSNAWGAPARSIFFFFIPEDPLNPFWSEMLLQLAGVLLVLVIITMMGWLSQKLIGRLMVNLFERLVNTVPGVRTVYNTVKQIRDTFTLKTKRFSSVVCWWSIRARGCMRWAFSQGEGEGGTAIPHRFRVVNVIHSPPRPIPPAVFC
ncbi:MAG: DUF502 domain-containing protein [Verrucomicrobia bacterium]|nr:DUF502 domain-containing protein [Verrucomicrobiota bacterium]